AACEVQDRLDACAERILKEPVRGPEDLMLLCEACYWRLYTAPAGLWAPEADSRLAAGPPHDMSDRFAEALAALFKGVRDVGMPERSSRNLAKEAPMSPTTKREQWPSFHGNGRRYWDVISSGNWADDCQVG